MKLLELGLAAFGPFTDFTLDLSSPAGLHLMYGKNEAGKSTALRAITGLLYGIPHATRDAHTHPMRELRINGKIAYGAGRVLEFSRRKGSKNTLLDRAGQPLDEAELLLALGGVGQELFSTMFGLDHGALGRGAEALLRGKGDLGETLFDAGTSGAGVHELLAQLDREADELFRPRAKTSRVNVGLAALKEARQRARQAATDPAAYERQLAELEDARRQLDAIETRRRELKTELERLGRVKSALPKLAKRGRLLAERSALGPGPLLPEDARSRREHTERTLEDSARQAARLDREIADLSERLAELVVPEALAALDDGSVRELEDRLGSHHKAHADLPARRGALAVLEGEVSAVLERLDPELGPDALQRRRLDAAGEARLRKLARAKDGLDARLAEAVERLAAIDARRAELLRRLERTPEPSDTSALDAALAAEPGDLDRRCAEAEQRARALRQDCEQRLAALEPCPVGLDCVTTLAVPLPETIDRFERELGELQSARAGGAERSREVDARQRALVRQREELGRSGALPTLAELEAARAERDCGWRGIRGAWEAGRAAEAAEAAAFERSVADADRVADRLRGDAERVARAARIDEELAELARERAGLDLQLSDIAEQLTHAQGAWRELWAPLGIEPRTPREMRGWHARFSGIVDQARRWEEAAELAARLEAERECARAELCRATGEEPAPASVLGLVERARARLAEAREKSRERAALARDADALAGEHAEQAARVAARRDEQAAWATQWRAAIAALGIGAEATPDEVVAILDAQAELFRARDAAARERHRIDAIVRDADELARDVSRLLAEHAPELAELPFDKAARRLLDEHREVRKIQVLRRELEAQLARKRDERRTLGGARAGLEQELLALLRAAGAETSEELAEREARSERWRELERELAEAHAELEEDLVGASLAALERETEGVDPMALRVRLSEIEEQLEEHEQAWKDAHARVTSAEHGLERFGHSTAMEAEQEAQARASEIRQDVDHYVRVKLAATLLRREIERYRERHQGPVVARASELFAKLTRGSFSGVRADVDARAQPVLVCTRQRGAPLEVEALSEGTREQLYLALRLASLQHYGQRSELLPLVLDDVLIHSDEDRTLAALELMGELGEQMQILLFTHHAHLVELARRAVPGTRLAVHDLPAPGSARELELSAGG